MEMGSTAFSLCRPPLPWSVRGWRNSSINEASCFRRRSITTACSVNGAPFVRQANQQQYMNALTVVQEDRLLKSGLVASQDDGTIVYDDDDDAVNEDAAICTAPTCPVPEFSTTSNHISLLTPCKISWDCRPLLVYVPGMDCTGQGIKRQLPYLIDAGYDVKCVYIPSGDRSSWEQLVQTLIPLLRQEKLLDGKERHVTLLGESFGGPLALRLIKAAPELISRLVLVNPATNLQQSNALASFLSTTGLLAHFPIPLYKTAQDVLLPLMVNRDRVKLADSGDVFSPVDLVPASCAAWRLSLLNDNSGLGPTDISSIKVPTLLLSSSEDHLLSSVQESGRLNRLLPNSKRVILHGSGHTALLEDAFNLPKILETHGFSTTAATLPSITDLPLVGMRKNAVRDEVLDEMGKVLEPWRFLTSPLISGEEYLPSPELNRPILFVGNHTMFGSYDTPLLFYELFLRGFRCRGLAHPGHWQTFIGKVFERYGHVKATKLAAYKLLKHKEHVLLFPGGAREVFKKKGEEYKLLWKPTTDFVRMAARFDTVIVPFASLGGDDAYRILFDGDDILGSPFAPIVKDVYNRIGISLETIYPVTALPGTSIPSLVNIPNIERIYFHFAEPVDTQAFEARSRGDKHAEMYAVVKERVENSISLLKDVRLNDKERELHKRLSGKILDLLPEFTRPRG